MFESERERVRRAMEGMAQGEDKGRKFRFDRRTRTVRNAAEVDPDDGLDFVPSDTDLFISC